MPAPSRVRRTPKQARRAIDRLDLATIGKKAIQTYRWRPARARNADLWYRNFLWLCYKHNAPVAAIGKDADDFWHLHILDTRKYARDCKSVFGRFLEHKPIYGRPTARDIRLFDATTHMYMLEFGRLPRILRPISSSSAAS